jgi:hypothetical protein
MKKTWIQWLYQINIKKLGAFGNIILDKKKHQFCNYFFLYSYHIDLILEINYYNKRTIFIGGNHEASNYLMELPYGFKIYIFLC